MYAHSQFNLTLSIQQMSTQKLQKIPAVILSISVTGVRFIDARSRVSLFSLLRLVKWFSERYLLPSMAALAISRIPYQDHKACIGTVWRESVM